MAPNRADTQSYPSVLRIGQRSSSVKAAGSPAARPIQASTSQTGSSARTCQYIYDKGPWVLRPPLWCGDPIRLGSVYCEGHHQLCHIRRYTRADT